MSSRRNREDELALQKWARNAKNPRMMQTGSSSIPASYMYFVMYKKEKRENEEQFMGIFEPLATLLLSRGINELIDYGVFFGVSE